ARGILPYQPGLFRNIQRQVLLAEKVYESLCTDRSKADPELPDHIFGHPGADVCPGAVLVLQQAVVVELLRSFQDIQQASPFVLLYAVTIGDGDTSSSGEAFEGDRERDIVNFHQKLGDISPLGTGTEAVPGFAVRINGERWGLFRVQGAACRIGTCGFSEGDVLSDYGDDIVRSIGEDLLLDPVRNHFHGAVTSTAFAVANSSSSIRLFKSSPVSRCFNISLIAAATSLRQVLGPRWQEIPAR